MRTSELIGPALDWAVAKCEGLTFEWDGGAAWVYPPEYSDYVAALRVGEAMSINNSFIPSTDWAQGGPIIEREIAVIRKGEQSKVWFASVMDASMDYMTSEGPTPLVTAMRCYVASKLGDDVEIPEELK